MINTPNKQLKNGANQLHPGLQLLLFVAIFIGVLLICNVALIAIYGLQGIMDIASLSPSTPHLNNSLWVMQLVGTTLPIFAASVFFAKVIVNDEHDYIKPGFHFHWALFALVFLVMFMSNPAMELLSNINEKMKLPHYLKGLEDWMKDSEDSAQKITDVMLRMNTIWDMLLDLLLIGLLTAIVEEFMFRGVIQTIFVRWTKSVHAAVWITAILFSAFHMEFYGFLPRLLLGVLFGYFVAWSGSIWPAVLAHFLNNASDVVITYLSQHKLISLDVNNEHVFNYIGYSISIAAIGLLLFVYHKIASKEIAIPQEHGEELD